MPKSSPKYWLYPPGFYLSRYKSQDKIVDITITFLTGSKSGVQYNRAMNWDGEDWTKVASPGFHWLNWNCVDQHSVETIPEADVEYYPTFEAIQTKYKDDPVIGPMVSQAPKPPPKKKAAPIPVSEENIQVDAKFVEPSKKKKKISSQDCIDFTLGRPPLKGITMLSGKFWKRTEKYKAAGGIVRRFQILPGGRINGFLGFYDAVVMEAPDGTLTSSVIAKRYNDHGVEVDAHGVPVPQGMQPTKTG